MKKALDAVGGFKIVRRGLVDVKVNNLYTHIYIYIQNYVRKFFLGKGTNGHVLAGM